VTSGERLARLGVVADLVLAAVLTAFLFIATSGWLDAVPRPLALLGLYATPGIVGAFGVMGRRRALLLAAAIALLPGSFLSMAGVTLVFLLPLVLFAAAASQMARDVRWFGELADVVVLFGLMLGAGVALLALTANTCATNPSAAACSSAALTIQGVAAELALLVAAIGYAAWRAGLLPASRRGAGS
jgi:hypothetical protein